MLCFTLPPGVSGAVPGLGANGEVDRVSMTGVPGRADIGRDELREPCRGEAMGCGTARRGVPGRTIDGTGRGIPLADPGRGKLGLGPPSERALVTSLGSMMRAEAGRADEGRDDDDRADDGRADPGLYDLGVNGAVSASLCFFSSSDWAEAGRDLGGGRSVLGWGRVAGVLHCARVGW
ncbi:hypothetical protein J8273_6250 [Carpediemonas membranifera]|uniref:Uncharacterized protein n=1 Tax=Carpediemonas membranifera TaxID=201153 RepID=A0A8J6B0A0_9EUKA|nr:hypothetical protein J8273_6250 [Carpediemonas membranifera]|eukprot:KAG9391489.1 hypothetical protein J8273_6250 [Carpediemonas membranifera]